jgi:hypothetical protein
MISTALLLRLYPRPWRERYGEEFQATVGDHVNLRQALDVVTGAVDARFSADVRGIIGDLPVQPSTTMVATRDAMIGAAVMLSSTAALTLLGIAARANGRTMIGALLLNMGFLASLMLSMPFWILKGRPWKLQAGIIGLTLVMLAVIGYANG